MGDNGIISLNNSYNSYEPKSLPINEFQLIVPYWGDSDIRETGNVFYRQTRDPTLLARATNETQAAFPTSENVIVINLLIVTWDAVGISLGTLIRWSNIITYMYVANIYIITNPYITSICI